MEEGQTEGLILQTLNYRDRGQILTVFTPTLGIVKLIINKINPARPAASPLTLIHCIYAKGKSDLWKCIELHLKDLFLSLREKYEFLEEAGEMLQCLMQLQFQETPAPPLYLLLLHYLKKIPYCKPKVLSTSFRLKMLRYEGVLRFDRMCAICGKDLKEEESRIDSGACYCTSHSPNLNPIDLTNREADLIERLLYCQTSAELYPLEISSSFYQKIINLNLLY